MICPGAVHEILAVVLARGRVAECKELVAFPHGGNGCRGERDGIGPDRRVQLRAFPDLPPGPTIATPSRS